MFITELDTFVRKFHQLWNDGLTAHLDLDTHAGNAWVGLGVQLGQVPGPPHQQVQPSHQHVNRKFESLSHQWRRARRAAARAENTTNTEAVEAVERENETEAADAKVPDVEMHDETFDGKISEVAAEATADNVIDAPLNDEVCCDAEYSSQKVTGQAIPQVDGTVDEKVMYNFVSDFHREDIEYAIQEFMPEDIETKLVSVVRIGGLQSADQLCTLMIRMPPEKNFIWPMMSRSQSEVIKELKSVPHFNPA
jgi:hypothetical protein